jgi:hypothetical protein
MRLVREGARRMLLTALRAEVDEYLAEHIETPSRNSRASVGSPTNSSANGPA